jgi:polysaccharide chain length determinant protein (PEP-CTERM system associated)
MASQLPLYAAPNFASARTQIEDLIATVASILRGMWRYRWPAVSLAWATCVAGWLYVASMPDVYEASTRVFIDAESMIERVVGDLTVSGDMMTEINVLTRVMLSQPQLEKTARDADLYLRAQSDEDKERLIEQLRSRVVLSREGGENIFRISYSDSDRQTAERVVQTLFDNFVEDALGDRRTDSGAAEEFLQSQIDEYERRLNEAESRRAAFKRDNIGLMPGETGDYYTRLQLAMSEQQSIQAELRLAMERRTEYEKQLIGEEPVFGIMSSTGAVATGQDAVVEQYESNLNELLLRYIAPAVHRQSSGRDRVARDNRPHQGATSVGGSGDGEPARGRSARSQPGISAYEDWTG